MMKPKMMRIALGVAVLVGLNGCANISTIGRSTDLPAGGKAVHLDAAQRVLISDSSGFSCSEPAPDALQAYASSFGVGAGRTATGESVSLANAFATSAGSIGLRTQSITLMRDHLFRICELRQNKIINDRQAYLMFKSAQELTMGILAIEQLTGAVVANQLHLSSDANAVSKAEIDDLAAKRDQAQKNEEVKRAIAEVAAKKKIDSTTAKNATKANIALAEAETPKDAAKVQKLNDLLAAQEKQLEKDTNAFETADLNAKQATAEAKFAAALLGSATTRATAAAKGTAGFASNNGSQNINPATVAEIARATEKIVEMVLNKGQLTDVCIDLAISGKVDSGLMNACIRAIDATIDLYKASNGGENKKSNESMNSLQSNTKENKTQAAPSQFNSRQSSDNKKLLLPPKIIVK